MAVRALLWVMMTTVMPFFRLISCKSFRMDLPVWYIGFVFQFYNLVPNLTALENVELAAQICKHPLNPEEVLRSVGLGELGPTMTHSSPFSTANVASRRASISTSPMR